MSLKKVRDDLNTLREQANDVASNRHSGALEEMREQIARSYIAQREHPEDRPSSIMDKLASPRNADVEEAYQGIKRVVGAKNAVSMAALAFFTKDRVNAERGWSKVEEEVKLTEEQRAAAQDEFYRIFPDLRPED
jgi:hypothetical protein